MIGLPPRSPLLPYTTLFRSFYPVASPVHALDPRAKILATAVFVIGLFLVDSTVGLLFVAAALVALVGVSRIPAGTFVDRKSTRLNSSHANISSAVFCLTKKR